MKKAFYPLLIVLLAAATSCVYPFELEQEATRELLVIDGDIVPGSSSEITLSYVSPLTNDLSAPVRRPLTAVVRLEVDRAKSEGGNLYYEVTEPTRREQHGTVYTIRLTDPALFSPSDPGAHRYRLAVENGDNGHTYVSEWMQFDKAGMQIRDVYSRLTDGESTLSILMDFRANGGYYRISYKEDWHYTAMYPTNCTYIVPPVSYGRPVGNGQISMVPLGRYECWNHAESYLLSLVENESHSEKDVDGYLIKKIRRSDTRLNQDYRIDVQITSISPDAYLYYQHLKEVTEFDGSLFSPNPSEMRGNIRCVEDPDELVIGFVDLVRVAKQRRLFSRAELPIYVEPKHYFDTEPVPVSPTQWYTYYKQGYLPFNYDPDTNSTLWADKRCLDCTISGGTTVRPEDWY